MARARRDLRDGEREKQIAAGEDEGGAPAYHCAALRSISLAQTDCPFYNFVTSPCLDLL